MEQTNVGRPGKKQNRQRNKEIGGFHIHNEHKKQEKVEREKAEISREKKGSSRGGRQKVSEKGCPQTSHSEKANKEKNQRERVCVTSLFVDIRTV